MHPDRPSDPNAEQDGDESIREVVRRAEELTPGRSPHDRLEAIEHERSKRAGEEIARERGEAVPDDDDDEGRE